MGKISPLLLIALITVGLAGYVLSKTVFGLHLRMVGESPTAGKTLGIYVNRIRFQVLSL